eukprot:364915-Chlamydomonas_euryale.AAC.11
MAACPLHSIDGSLPSAPCIQYINTSWRGTGADSARADSARVYLCDAKQAIRGHLHHVSRCGPIDQAERDAAGHLSMAQAAPRCLGRTQHAMIPPLRLPVLPRAALAPRPVRWDAGSPGPASP